MILILIFISMILTGGNALSNTHTQLPTKTELAKLSPDGGPDFNRLVFEKSPYLLQHATNPVNWYPWGKEAFAKAKKENKPIFLSIGYATCHWCHVMEKSSFIDKEVADLLNRFFVCIKVDREERPDIDHIYMSVCQAMTGSGGWPLTVFLTPELKPFFAGTFFPKNSSPQRIGMMDLLPRVHDTWEKQRPEIEASAAKITAQLLAEQQGSLSDGGPQLNESILDAAFEGFTRSFDSEDGGFGRAPKFPTPHQYRFLLRYAHRTGNQQALHMVTQTLQSMRKGGIFDHVGKGFHRYSTDAEWLLPHFEKMLYDQALISMAYIECYQATGNPAMLEVAEEVFEYVLRDMVHPEGGFYSAEDADSDGEEGKFYVWTKKELFQILSKEDADFYIDVFNFTDEGTFRDESTNALNGANIPHLTKAPSLIASEHNISVEDLKKRIARIDSLLFQIREKRIHPLKDDKVLTDWNGLMIAAFSKGYAVTGKEPYLKAAKQSVDFIWKHLYDPKTGLKKRFRDGHAGLDGLLDDYAFLIYGLLELYQADFDIKYLQKAVMLMNESKTRFWDPKDGGFFQSEPRSDLVARLKDLYDGALPSGNSVMADNLIRISHLTGNLVYEEMAWKIFTLFANRIQRYPMGFTQLLMAFDRAIGPSREIVIAVPDGQGVGTLKKELGKRFLPRSVFLLQNPKNKVELAALCSYTEAQNPVSGKTTFFLCEGFACKAPITDKKDFFKELDTKKK